MVSGTYLECTQRQNHRELLPFDPEPKRTLHRLRKETHVTQLEIMQHQVDAGHIHDGDGPQVEKMERIVEIQPPHLLYSLIIIICYFRSFLCHL